MNSSPLRIIFFGTPTLSVTILESLLVAGYQIPLVITSPDKPVGRKQVMTPPPVKVFAESKGLTVIRPQKLTDEVLEHIRSSGAELGVVVAYGHIIPESIIKSLPKGLLNIHYSLLPKLRGASPVEQAILSGQKETGVTIQKLVFKLDAGPIVAVEKFEIDNQITTPELKDRLTEIGAKLLINMLPRYVADELVPQEQDESQATHCKKISKADGEIKLSDSDESKWLKYRGYFGWPGIFYFDEEGKRVKITEATFENGKFIIKKIIPEGKKEISL